jgi:hypothetical protein
MQLDKNKLTKMGDSTSCLDRVLAATWRDADKGQWPLQNQGQAKVVIEGAIQELQRLRENEHHN